MRLINVAIAAPQELSRERELILLAIEEVNQTFRDADLDIRLRRATADPEIIVGVFWWQFSIEAQELIRRGLQERREHGKPDTIVFFNQEPYSPTASRETQEWSQVLDLQQELSEHSVTQSFLGDEDFARKVGARLKGLVWQIARADRVMEFDAVAPITALPQVIPDAFTCSVVSTMRTVRAEGETELLGEIGLLFSGGIPVSQGGSVHSLRVELFLNAQVTNRIDKTGLSNAVLVREDELGGNQEIRGRVSNFVITFDKLDVEAPGANDTLSFSIRNVRANATPLLGAGPNAKIVGFIKVRPDSIVTVTSPLQDLAVVRPALKFSVVRPAGVGVERRISDIFVQSFSVHGEPLGLLRFTGLQPLAFRPRAAESNGDAAGTYTGTRLKIEMNIPAGIRVFVSIVNVGDREKARLITSQLDEYCERRATDTLEGIPVAEVALENGRANAVWEVVYSDLGENEVLDFAGFLKYDAHVESNMPLPGAVAVNGSFAPTPTFKSSLGAQAARPLPIPRFVGSCEPATKWFTVAIQCTSLLFPIVSNQGSLDTSIIISNVSADPLGTAPCWGSIELFFYGDNAPGTYRTGGVSAGQVYSTMASLIAPGFFGYVIARCYFAPARGVAIVRGFGASNAATSYLAEVIDVGDNRIQHVPSAVGTRRVSTLEVDSLPGELGD